MIVLAVVTTTPLKAQYFSLRSFEGKKVRVHLEELPHELRVSFLHDTLLLYEYFGDFRAKALDSSFLQITYAVRGGSGFGSENTALLAVREGHLCQALWLTSSFESVGYKFHHTLHTDLTLTGSRWNNYILTINSREYLRDESHPSGHHKKYRPALLRFNKNLMAFYSKTVVADSGFRAVEFNLSNEYIQFAAGDTLTMTRLAGDSCYYVEGSWYSPISAIPDSQHDTVIGKVFALPAVQQKSAWIDSVTGRRHGISLTVLETADWPSDTGRYVLQAGYHLRQHFDPYYYLKSTSRT